MNVKSIVWAVLAVVPWFAWSVPAPAEARDTRRPTLADFGHGTLGYPNGTKGSQERPKARGERPLLVLMPAWNDRDFKRANTEARYRNLYFGARGATVAGYFKENSLGAFTYKEAGLVRFRIPRLPVAGGDLGRYPGAEVSDRHLQAVLRYVADAGLFDYARYDLDRDGRVTTEELTIVIVPAGSSDGKTRPLDLRTRKGRLVGDVVTLGEDRGINTTCHELMHTLGAHDIYGPGAKYNEHLSLMGGRKSPSGANAEDFIYHVDPWHKMRLGWITPHLLRLDRSSSMVLHAVQARGPHPERSPRAVLLYDPDAGLGEFYLLEHRAGKIGVHDRDAGHAGLVVWHVKTERGHMLQDYVPEGPGTHGYTLQYVGQARSRGIGPLPAAGTSFALRTWRGEMTGTWLRYSPAAPTTPTIRVEWSVGNQVTEPIITSGDVSIQPGHRIQIRGTFGVRVNQVAALFSANHQYDLGIYTWSPGRIMLEIPGDVPPGRYRLVIYPDERRVPVNFGVAATVQRAPLQRIDDRATTTPKPRIRVR